MPILRRLILELFLTLTCGYLKAEPVGAIYRLATINWRFASKISFYLPLPLLLLIYQQSLSLRNFISGVNFTQSIKTGKTKKNIDTNHPPKKLPSAEEVFLLTVKLASACDKRKESKTATGKFRPAAFSVSKTLSKVACSSERAGASRPSR